MRLFAKKQKNFFSSKEEKRIVNAIQDAEKKSSGEIRVHIDEEKVEHIKDRAVYLFDTLGMKETRERNGILIYLHPNQKNFLVMGDEGIHKVVGQDFWERISAIMKTHFVNEQFAQGVIEAVQLIGHELKEHFPYDEDTDENELDDEISYQA